MQRYFTQDQFIARFGEEILLAGDIYARMAENGFPEYALAEFDATFSSNQPEKLQALGVLLRDVYGATVKGISERDGFFELTADFPVFPVDADNLLCWAVDQLWKGFEQDCRLEGYGTSSTTQEPTFPDEEPGRLAWYFEEGLRAWDMRNFGMTSIHFTTAIRIFPENANAWYSRAIARDQLFLYAKARADYDKALELSPSFVEAYINRAVNNDRSERYAEAMADYERALELEPENATAYYNRGNTKFNRGDRSGACEDWEKAKALGAAFAEERLAAYCR
ncbi:tetratricopeptide repeat protein [Chitinophaga lutea]